MFIFGLWRQGITQSNAIFNLSLSHQIEGLAAGEFKRLYGKCKEIERLVMISGKQDILVVPIWSTQFHPRLRSFV